MILVLLLVHRDWRLRQFAAQPTNLVEEGGALVIRHCVAARAASAESNALSRVQHQVERVERARRRLNHNVGNVGQLNKSNTRRRRSHANIGDLQAVAVASSALHKSHSHRSLCKRHRKAERGQRHAVKRIEKRETTIMSIKKDMLMLASCDIKIYI